MAGNASVPIRQAVRGLTWEPWELTFGGALFCYTSINKLEGETRKEHIFRTKLPVPKEIEEQADLKSIFLKKQMYRA